MFTRFITGLKTNLSVQGAQLMSNTLSLSVLISRPTPTSPVTTTSANQPTTSHLSWRSTLETWAAPAAGVGELAEAGAGAVGEAPGRHAGEDGPKR